MKIEKNDSLEKLKQTKSKFIELLNQKNFSLEIYKPNEIDLQSPHDRDEIYIIISGFGEFQLEEQTFSFKENDFFYVEKSKQHKFINFSEDFSTWVIFLN